MADRINEKKEAVSALEKLEEIVEKCSEDVPSWIRIATENNLKSYYKKQITEEDYLAQRREIIDYESNFLRCRCR